MVERFIRANWASLLTLCVLILLGWHIGRPIYHAVLPASDSCQGCPVWAKGR